MNKELFGFRKNALSLAVYCALLGANGNAHGLTLLGLIKEGATPAKKVAPKPWLELSLQPQHAGNYGCDADSGDGLSGASGSASVGTAPDVLTLQATPTPQTSAAPVKPTTGETDAEFQRGDCACER